MIYFLHISEVRTTKNPSGLICLEGHWHAGRFPSASHPPRSGGSFAAFFREQDTYVHAQ